MKTLKFKSGVSLLFLASLFLASCGEQSELDQPGITDGEIVEVTKEISINVLPIQSVGAATRSAATGTPEEGEAIGLTYGSDAATRVQTGSDAMTTNESKITKAYLVQFNGTLPTSTAAVVADVTSQLSSGKITTTLKMASGVKNRVYVITNPATPPTVNMTLANFEKPVVFDPTSTCPTAGLPMSARQDIGVGDTFDVFQLRSMLAKLTFTAKTSSGTTITSSNVKLKGLPNGYSFFTQPAGDAAVRPTGMTYSTIFTLTSGTTYYVPENLSGRNDLLIHPYTRALGMAVANAMYVEIINNSVVYNLLLGDGSASDFNFVGGYSYAINATLYGTDTYDLRVGNPVTAAPIDLNTNGETANCYIAGANGWYMFNSTVMGNGKITPANGAADADDITPTKLKPVSVDVLWETQNTGTAPAKGDIVNNNLYFLKDRILFRSGAKVGNAVIAARDASNNIIWSWHIWRTDTDPTASPIPLKDITDGSDFTASGLQLMDRNLGALERTESATDASIGLYYQWGRKDPFPGAATLSAANKSTDFAKATNIDFATDQSSSPVSVEVAIAHPTTFYAVNNADWCITRNDNLWGTPSTGIVSIISYTFNRNKGSKSIYDPCPVGWRVPPAYAFVNAIVPTSSFAKGYNFAGKLTASAKLFMTASGNRNNYDGSLDVVGADGSFWTSSPHATFAGNGAKLRFYGSIVNPMEGSGRVPGTSCRCVKEL